MGGVPDASCDLFHLYLHYTVVIIIFELRYATLVDLCFNLYNKNLKGLFHSNFIIQSVPKYFIHNVIVRLIDIYSMTSGAALFATRN